MHPLLIRREGGWYRTFSEVAVGTGPSALGSTDDLEVAFVALRRAGLRAGRVANVETATTYRELAYVPGGRLLIDDPWMRKVGFWATEDGIRRTFDDVESPAGGCRLDDRRHDYEPGCAVRNNGSARRAAAGAAHELRQAGVRISATARMPTSRRQAAKPIIDR
jgi:hypothetical protein